MVESHFKNPVVPKTPVFEPAAGIVTTSYYGKKVLEDDLDLIKSLIRNLGQTSLIKKEVENSVDRDETATSRKDLIEQGFEIDVAESGEIALEKFNVSKPDGDATQVSSPSVISKTGDATRVSLWETWVVSLGFSGRRGH